MKHQLIDQVFGHWTVTGGPIQRHVGVARAVHRYWECRCKCGGTGCIPTQYLLTGRSTSCGCLAREKRASPDRPRPSYAKSLDETVFDNPTAEGEYWIGFLMADGCIVKDKRWDSWQVTLTASEVDARHIERFKEFLKSDATIRHHCARRQIGPVGTEINTQAFDTISVGSKRLAVALARYGVVPRKSLTARAEQLESSRHFWRGVVDGDGFIVLHKVPYGPAIPMIGLTGSKAIVEQFSEFVRSINPGAKAAPKPTGTIYHLRVAGKFAIPIIEHLYQSGDVALPRKSEAAAAMCTAHRQYMEDRTKPRKCCVSDCPRAIYGQKEWCQMHYKRVQRHGTTDALRTRVPITSVASTWAKRKHNRVALRHAKMD